MPTPPKDSRPRLEAGERFGAGRGAALALLLVLAVLGTGCASTRSDVALAPLWTNISTAGGGREIEALAGIVRVKHREYDGPLREWALRPFVNETIEESGDRTARFLVPWGTRKISAFRYLWQMLFLARYERTIDEQGRVRWSLITIPLNYFAEDQSGRTKFAVFPLVGLIEGFLTFDRIEFALFPLYLRTVRDGQVSTSFLWPIFNWTYGPRGTSYRIWPLFGRLRQEGRFDRKFVLWPIFHWSRNFLDTPNPESRWMVWPLYGHTRRGSYHAESVLWPFFGWAHNPKTGFWAWDGPWPLVRFLRPGSDDPHGPRRSRVWPFWSSYEGDGLKSVWAPFPLFNRSEEVDMLGTRKSVFFVPVVQDWVRIENDGTRAAWTKVWPLFQNYERGQTGRMAIPALNPLWRQPEIDFQYAWIYELVTREVDGERTSWRSWGNLYRREIDEFEDRSYLSFLWSRRAYRADEKPRVEHSLLFGLLRWRSHPERAGSWPELMAPSFPGPGWPMQRRGSTKP